MKRHAHPRKLQTHQMLILVLLYLLFLDIALTLMFVATKHDLNERDVEVAAALEQLDQATEQNHLLSEALVMQRGDFVAGAPTPPHRLDVPLSEDLQDYIWSLCCAYDIEEHYDLVYALIRHESNFDAAALSPSNDYGLMQINVVNHTWLREQLGIVDFFDPYQNAHGGIYILASLLHKYEVPEALMAYNMGENGAAKLWQRGVHTTPYAEQVLDYYKQFTENI